MKPCVLIPSYNEERTIGGITKRVKRLGLEVVVIDDGSTDNSEKAASDAGAIVIRHIKNLGKGASLKEGFDFVLKVPEYDPVITMDGDGQHNPADIESLLSHSREHGDDIVVGNRMASPKNMPFVRLATNRFMSNLLSRLCGQDISDTQCGFRLIRRRVLEKLTLESKNYDIESELLIKASRKGFKIGSVPIEAIYKNEISYIDPVKDTLRFIGLVLKTGFK